MRAVVYERYGTPDVLELREIPRPAPKDNELLVKVHASTVTAGDWRLRKADPFLARIFNGLFRPRKIKVLGFEVAGVVEETGKKVTSFKKGDAVFASCGLKFGGYAEYKVLPENDLVAIKPSNIGFDEAATVPIGGLTALGFLQMAGIRAGQEVLVYGASGSVGTYAVQLAKYAGASVTAVCSTANLEMVRLLGADKLIDYTKEDFSNTTQRFDIVFDAVGKASKQACKKLLKPGGRFVSVTGNPKKVPGGLNILKDIIEAGKLKPVIDRKYTLEQIREAHTYVEGFHKKGNVVLQVLP